MKKLFKEPSNLYILLIALLASGFTYWFIPYKQVNLLETYFLIRWINISIFTGLLGVLLFKRPMIQASLMTSLGFLVAVFGRIIIEVIQDPTDHNLWPFEIILALILSFPTALLGALLATFFRKKTT